ncbi:MAG TPA: D-alanyl-D-alanine carboxypeptidase family protein [Oscillospiraceae bacterium]|nr:D-alanyl-D-alanine carboxypeptidase [Oscillospiraceae bacterium]HNW04706.1 D-alanyl-D-alanine carboxypeptidase family protein [Oscillospiraceae bacterium]
MKKLAAGFLFLLTVLGFCAVSFADCGAAVLIDGATGRVFFEQGKDIILPMASTTKIMTALLALEEEDLDQYFTVNSRAIRVEGSSMGLEAGDRVTLRVLAAGMLLASGNDAANAAAVRIAGSVEAFSVRMNLRAAEIGMTNTHFVTPSGLDDEEHYSTAYDMALLAREALKNPDFAAICSQSSMRVRYGNPPYDRWLANHNRLLKMVEGATGVKTGFTKKSGRCLVSAAERNGVSLICVTLHCSDDWNYHKEIYEEYFGLLRAEELSGFVGGIRVPVAGSVVPSVRCAVRPVTAALMEGELQRIEAAVFLEPFLFAPVEAGETVGRAVFSLDGREVAAAEIYAAEDAATVVGKPGFPEWVRSRIISMF